MKNTLSSLFFAAFILLTGCKDEVNSKLEYTNLKTVEIGNYAFEFPSHFQLTDKQGIDSYVGEVSGSGITFSFDYGIYTSPYENLSAENFDVIIIKSGTVEKQLIVGKNPLTDFTGIHIRDIGSPTSLGNYVSLQMTTVGLSSEQQELVLHILNSGKLK